jgi:hypothetical protein
MKGPDPKSTRSKKRANRGFQSVESSTRKGRRAAKRIAIACTILGQKRKPGEDVQVTTKTTHRAGGRLDYH